MRPFVSAEEMRQIDYETMRGLSLTSFELMDRVSGEMTEALLADLDSQDSVTILCGPGNNGGDGYRLAEKLRQSKRNVFVYEVLPAKSADAVKAKSLYLGEFRDRLKKSDVIVDAVFGSGGRDDLPSSVDKVLCLANEMNAFRVALDVPTGVDTANGSVHANAFMADLTLCVGYPKSVFCAEEVAETLGRVRFVGDYFAKPTSATYFALEESDFEFHRIKRAGHKGLQGRVGVVGGSSETPGAPFLAAEAAYRVGAGYCSVYFSSGSKLNIKIRDASFLLRLNWKMEDLKTNSALVLGPGGFPKAKIKLHELHQPLVIDAEALKLFNLGSIKPMLPPLRSQCILTPHMKEAALMLQSQVQEVKADRMAALQHLAKKSGQSIYLKGAPGLLQFASEPQNTYVNLCANPVFSKAGSGDILSGILGGFLAQHPNDFKSAVISALIFQREVGEVLRDNRGSFTSDQLEVFSKAFDRLKTFRRTAS